MLHSVTCKSRRTSSKLWLVGMDAMRKIPSNLLVLDAICACFRFRGGSRAGEGREKFGTKTDLQ